jgi:osmotically-inducible protein OsmY
MRGSTYILVAVVAVATSACAGSQHASQRAADRATTTRVEARLAADPDGSMMDVDVDTIDGIVTLRGETENETERIAAIDVARHTKGVKGVRDLLVVEDRALGDNMQHEFSDAWIRAKVGTRLTSDPDISRFRLDIDVDGGVVTLSGTVPNEYMKRHAEEVAMKTEGVKRVKNELRIATPRELAPVEDDEEKTPTP